MQQHNHIRKVIREYIESEILQTTSIADSFLNKIWYHGVGPKGKFDKFDKSYIGSTSGNFGHYGKGFYFTDTPNKAKAFSEFFGGTGEVISAKLNIKKPFVVNQKNLIELGEKYHLNLPKKIPIKVNFKDFAHQLKEKFPIAYELIMYIHQKGYEKGWEVFLKKYGNNIPESDVDLNTVCDWYEETQKTTEDYGIENWVVEEMKKYGITPLLEFDYVENLNMAYLTDLGQNSEEWTNAIKSEEYDGIFAGEEVVVFEPEQIKII